MLTALAGLLVLCAIAAVRFLRHPVSGSGRSLEVVSGLWTVLMYLGLGVCPLAWAVWRAS